jgi:hypothetical protein
MNREERTAFLGVLIPVVYGSWVFLDKGTFIFPFPLNELIFFTITLQFLLWNLKSDKIKYGLFFCTALFGLVSSDFFWTIFFDGKSYEQLMLSPLTDIFKLIHLVGIGICLTLEINAYSRYKIFLFFCIPLLFLTGILYSSQAIIILSIIITTVFSNFKRPIAPSTLLLCLFSILEVGKLLMFQLI